MKTPSDEPPPPLPTQALPPTQAPHPSVLGRKLNASFTKNGGKKKKPQGAASQRKKPASFIKSPTFIKTSCGAGSYQPPPILPPPQNPSKHLSLAPLLNQEFGYPLEVPSPLKIRSDPQSSSKLQISPSPSAPIFFFSTIPRPRF